MVLGAAVCAQSWKCEEKQTTDCDCCWKTMFSSPGQGVGVLCRQRENSVVKCVVSVLLLNDTQT